MSASEGGPSAVTTGPGAATPAGTTGDAHTGEPRTGESRTGGAPFAPDPAFERALAAALAPALAVERELAGGGMARVFVAVETALARRVVVKVLPPDLAAGVNRERFRREIQLAANLQHPHVVPLLAAGEVPAAADPGAPTAPAAGSLYYTMPFIEGESLRAEAAARVARGASFSPREVRRLLHDVADALAYAHARGVVHRDVKPGNVLLQHGHALVTDFGVAKALAPGGREASAVTMTALGMAIGTPAYMAPEQLAADPAADHRVDLYAAGLVAYELLAGSSPFAEASPQATLAAQLTRVPLPIADLRPDVPPALAAAVMRCLAKDPADRPATATELLGMLDGEAGAAYVAAGAGASGTAPAFLASAAASSATPAAGGAPQAFAPTAPAALSAAATSNLPATVAVPAAAARARGRRGLLWAGAAAALAAGGVWAAWGGDGASRRGARNGVAQAELGRTGQGAAGPSGAGSSAAAAAAPRLTRADSVAIAAAVAREFEAALARQKRTPADAPPAGGAPLAGRAAAGGRATGAAAAPAAAAGAAATPSRAPASTVDPAVTVAVGAAAAARARVVDSLVRTKDEWGHFSRDIVRAVVGRLPVDVHTLPPEARREFEKAMQKVPFAPPVPPNPDGPPGADGRYRALAAVAAQDEARPGARRVALVGFRDATGVTEFRPLTPILENALRERLRGSGQYDATGPAVGAVARRERAPDGVVAGLTGAGAVVRGQVALEGDVAVATLVVTDAARGTHAKLVSRAPAAPGAQPPAVAEALAEPLARQLGDVLRRVTWGAPRVELAP